VQIEDYRRSGAVVVGIVGVDGSPSCGVATTLAMGRALDQLGRLERGATAEEVNAVVRATAISGTGMYVELLREELARRGIDVPFIAHDLLAEIDGRPAAPRIEALLDGAG
jgi:predicted secreted protein